ncbi:hypothetical protein, partial [Faecalibaculum rodentium]|uniref:hypothetical protein n=1 Tax=Faecalibaculum rodentium TaxID=1702221 RepID=UPI002630AD7D
MKVRRLFSAIGKTENQDEQRLFFAGCLRAMLKVQEEAVMLTADTSGAENRRNGYGIQQPDAHWIFHRP